MPPDLDMDLVLVVDGSRRVRSDHYAGLRELLASVVEQLAVSPQPRRADGRARVALVQQSGSLHPQSGSLHPQQAARLEFGLQTFQSQSQMKHHLLEETVQQGGASALGHALDYALREVLLRASSPRKHRVLLVAVGAETPAGDLARLRRAAQEASCAGVVVLVVAVGRQYSQAQVEELASGPLKQHLLCLDGMGPEEQGHAQRFITAYLSMLRGKPQSQPGITP